MRSPYGNSCRPLICHSPVTPGFTAIRVVSASPNFGTASLEAPASRSSRSSEPNDSRAESVAQSMRMRTSSYRGRKSLPALSNAFWTAARAEVPFFTRPSAAAF